MTEEERTAHAKHVDDAISGRRSVRGFLPKEVGRETVARLLELGSMAPSATNVQPWKVYALAGAAKDALSKAVMEKFEAGGPSGREYDGHPKVWEEPWLSRRRSVGKAMYGLLGIPKDDREGMRRQTARNFLFFGAPVGLIFTLDKRLGAGMLMDIGMFMENVMIAARARGLGTCPQAFFADYPDAIRACLGIGQNEMIVCGMALGYADAAAPINSLRPGREPVAGFADFRGF